MDNQEVPILEDGQTLVTFYYCSHCNQPVPKPDPLDPVPCGHCGASTRSAIVKYRREPVDIVEEVQETVEEEEFGEREFQADLGTWERHEPTGLALELYRDIYTLFLVLASATILLVGLWAMLSLAQGGFTSLATLMQSFLPGR